MAKKKVEISVQDEWLIMKDALMEKGFPLEHIDKFMQRYIQSWMATNEKAMAQYVKNWFHQNIGVILQYSMEVHNQPVYSMFGNGTPELYVNTGTTTTITVRGPTNSEALERLRSY